MPARIPLTMPVLPAVAIKPALLLQVPPAVASVRAVVKPKQTDLVPVIAAGVWLNVTTTVLTQPEGST